MSSSPSYVVRFKWCALATMAITFLALFPQIHFWLMRGSQWHGAYVILQLDEVIYSAYINALIDGRPRRNDPVAGRDDHPQAPLPESVFYFHSFVPAYVIAFFARLFGASASSAFIVLMGAGGFLASLSVFWLLASVTGDNKLGAIGVLVVLCLGALAGGQGGIGLLLKPDVRFLGMPFLRSYEPSAPFPLVFVFCILIWQALTKPLRRNATVKALMAGVTLSILIFSYFYLWTAAAAWFVGVVCLWLVLRPRDRRRSMRVILIVSATVIPALGLFGYLLSRLPTTLDRPSALTLSHQPDLLRAPEIIGALLLGSLILGVRLNKFSRQDTRVIFAASLALVPFLVFNQQIITGRSIQPYHYEVYIANYLVLVGLVVTIFLLQPAVSRRAGPLIGAACLLLGTAEVSLALHARYNGNVRNDEMVPVLVRLREQAPYDGTWEGLRDHGKTSALVFSPQYGISTLLPTWAPQGSLLAPGSAYFKGPSATEEKERLYQHLYYCGRNGEFLRQVLNDRTDDPFLTHFVKSTIFGPERDAPFLTSNFHPIRQDEIEREVNEYESFATSFSHSEALKRPLGYAVTPSDAEFDFSHIDLWYERDAGTRVGAYILYRLKLRE